MCHSRRVKNIYLYCGHNVDLKEELIQCADTNCRLSPFHPVNCVNCKKTCWQYLIIMRDATVTWPAVGNFRNNMHPRSQVIVLHAQDVPDGVNSAHAICYARLKRMLRAASLVLT
ncbi:hypothetical protein BC827DRAFT_349573 [Russula dissimulans]|nr:hypothetical protein BC827DRAFT_349573 [Russula dissimulans]